MKTSALFRDYQMRYRITTENRTVNVLQRYTLHLQRRLDAFFEFLVKATRENRILHDMENDYIENFVIFCESKVDVI